MIGTLWHNVDHPNTLGLPMMIVGEDVDDLGSDCWKFMWLDRHETELVWKDELESLFVRLKP